MLQVFFSTQSLSQTPATVLLHAEQHRQRGWASGRRIYRTTGCLLPLTKSSHLVYNWSRERICQLETKSLSSHVVTVKGGRCFNIQNIVRINVRHIYFHYYVSFTTKDFVLQEDNIILFWTSFFKNTHIQRGRKRAHIWLLNCVEL